MIDPWSPVLGFDEAAEECAFLLLDAARDEALYPMLYDLDEDLLIQSLYQGDTAVTLAEVAPYLVALRPGDEAARRLHDLIWGNGWGMLLHAPLSFSAVRRHLRKFTLVFTEAGSGLVFRFYDPRVLQIFLPTCEPADACKLIGPLRWIAPGPQPHQATIYEVVEGQARTTTVALALSEAG
ncbi:MAG: DUF4123 domain-containing protein [Alphaproteobacteria bacterium]|nr:DUF4123 domain-containing protein [Alphaproteobacteria bacterium]